MDNFLLLASTLLAAAFILFIVGAERRKINMPWELIVVAMLVALIVFLAAAIVDNWIWLLPAVQFFAAGWIATTPADKAYYARKLNARSEPTA